MPRNSNRMEMKINLDKPSVEGDFIGILLNGKPIQSFIKDEMDAVQDNAKKFAKKILEEK